MYLHKSACQAKGICFYSNLNPPNLKSLTKALVSWRRANNVRCGYQL